MIITMKRPPYLLITFICGLLALAGCRSTSITSRPLPPETFRVFEPVAGAYTSMRIPALVMSKKGALLAFCEGRVNSASDWADIDLLMRRSTDGGKTWEPNVVIAARQSGQPTSNATPIVDQDGTIHLLYQRNYAVAYYTKSTDDGKTWSAPVDITYAFEAFRQEYDWKVLAPGPGHAIQLKNKRLVVPVWMALEKKHHPSCIATIYSDDLGKTWQRGDIIAISSYDFKDPSETMAVELEDGRVMLNIRNEAGVHRRAVSYSKDGATGWTKPVFDDELYEPICMASIISAGRGRLLFVNPDSRDLPPRTRKNLTVKLSYDQGEHWSVQKVLDTGGSGYSDLAVGPDGMVYCLYESNEPGKHYSLVLKRFNLRWLTDGKDK
jgi:sialidase-1